MKKHSNCQILIFFPQNTLFHFYLSSLLSLLLSTTIFLSSYMFGQNCYILGLVVTGTSANVIAMCKVMRERERDLIRLGFAFGSYGLEIGGYELGLGGLDFLCLGKWKVRKGYNCLYTLNLTESKQKIIFCFASQP